jgi:hypothetical protein
MLKNGYRADPKRTDDGASESPARGRCPQGAAEVGPAQHLFSRSGVPNYRHARPGGTTDGDGTDDGKRLAPPFRGNTDMGKREGHIIAGTCRGKREQQPNDQADYGRARDRKRELPSHERGTTRDEADGDGAERTCSRNE